jgi:predicted amidophosphoribosyltransferase
MKIRKRRKSFIRSLRHKLIFLLVVYFAGFATAIYCLVPVPQNTDNRAIERKFAHSVLKSDEFATAFNEGLHKVIDFSKSAALRTADFIKEEYKQRKAHADG